jgi:hypothetical protein
MFWTIVLGLFGVALINHGAPGLGYTFIGLAILTVAYPLILYPMWRLFNKDDEELKQRQREQDFALHFNGGELPRDE